MVIKIRKLVFLLVCTSSSLAFSGTGSGKVQIEHVYPPNKLFFYTTAHQNPPACNNYSQVASGSRRWVLDISTDFGRQQYSLLLAAQMADKDVRVGGTETCNIHSDSESVYWVGFSIN